MSFRHISYSVPLVGDGEVLTRVKKSVVVDDFGTELFSVSDVDDATLNASVPSSSDYTLDKLLNAGIPLKDVSLSIDSVDTQAEHFVNEHLVEPSNNNNNEN